ncbi:MAG: hypothetical protein HYW51_03205 [Candidatus Doudnabacteria bacterium]|nr:hypothetical protein [Candidatus Doudnabacteria bacterium]
MKTLHYRRHSLKDGNYISAEGLRLAFREGALCGVIHHKVFHGPLVRTAQTLLSFLQGRTGNSMIMPIIEEIGNDTIVAAMVNDAFKAAVKEGLPNIECLRRAHDNDKLAQFAASALHAVVKMFDRMNEGDIAVAFGHSPIITPPEGWDKLGELDGLVFVQDAARIRVTQVIRAQRDTVPA